MYHVVIHWFCFIGAIMNINLRNKGIDLIKTLAIVTMVVDHMRYLFPKYQLEFIAVGRMAFIMFACALAFNAVQIFENKRFDSLKKYFINLVLFGLISEIPYQLSANGANLNTHNIMLTLLLGLMAITALNVGKQDYIRSISFGVVIAFCLVFDKYIEFGTLGVLLIISFYLMFKFYQESKVKYVLVFSLVTTLLACLCNLQYYGDTINKLGYTSVWVYSMIIGCICGAVLSICLSLNLINLSSIKVKQVGRWAWWFYPVHLAIIAIIGKLFIW